MPRPKGRRQFREQDPTILEATLDWGEQAGLLDAGGEVHVRKLRMDGAEDVAAGFSEPGSRAARVLFASAGQIQGGAVLNAARAESALIFRLCGGTLAWMFGFRGSASARWKHGEVGCAVLRCMVLLWCAGRVAFMRGGVAAHQTLDLSVGVWRRA
eukprot:7621723-Alexandrium_andersonii.AAC.1